MATPDDFLAQEYLHLQKVIEDFDTKTLTIKAWSVTFSAVAIGFAYDKHESKILIVAASSALAFWLVEALLKVNQQAYYGRIEEIESGFSPGTQQQPFQIARVWGRTFDAGGGYWRVWKILIWPHVAVLYVVIAMSASILYFVDPPVMVDSVPIQKSHAAVIK